MNIHPISTGRESVVSIVSLNDTWIREIGINNTSRLRDSNSIYEERRSGSQESLKIQSHGGEEMRPVVVRMFLGS